MSLTILARSESVERAPLSGRMFDFCVKTSRVCPVLAKHIFVAQRERDTALTTSLKLTRAFIMLCQR